MNILTNVSVSMIEALEDQIAEQDALDALHAKRALHPKGKVRSEKGFEKHYRDADNKLNHVAWTRCAVGKPMSTLDEGLLDA
jgi:hypothetical protein